MKKRDEPPWNVALGMLAADEYNIEFPSQHNLVYKAAVSRELTDDQIFQHLQSTETLINIIQRHQNT